MLWMGIDVGTGGTRALLVDAKGKLVASITAPHEDIRMEKPFWAEQRPEDWWGAAQKAIRGVIAEAGVDGAAVQQPGGALGTHHRDLGRRPGVGDVVVHLP